MDEEQQPETGYSNLEISQGDAIEVDNSAIKNDVATLDTAENKRLPLNQYLRSGDFREIICCFIFGVLCMLTQYPGIPLNVRPIPQQELQDGEYVLNLSNDQTYVGDTVSNTAVVIIGFVAPLVLQFILCKTVGKFGDAHATICVYFVGTALVALSTNTIKSYVGYLRPVFYDLCQPNDDFQECTNSGSDDARKSFPSGHSSLAFSGMTLLTCYLLARFGVYSNTPLFRQNADGTLVMERVEPERFKRAISILCLAPMAIACFVAASRVKDNMHFPADVVGGAVLGTSIAWFTHGVWFLMWPSN